MHHVRINGSTVRVHHTRTHDQIRKRPHICAWGDGYWAVYYLRGQQSRIRCNIHPTLADAIKQAVAVSHYNNYRRR